MLKNFYLKIVKGKLKVRDREETFGKGNGTIALFITYVVIFASGQNTPNRRWTYLKKGSIEITISEKTQMVEE